MNILGYAKKYKDKSFFDEPFNNVDALILAELSYINFPAALSGEYFEYLKNIEIKEPKKFYYGSFDAPNNKKLINLIKDSERYGNMRVGFFDSFNELETNTQFFAMTIILPTGEAYISFRGTDITISGWKEDFLIAYKDTIPGQAYAEEYLKEAIKKFNGKFYIGGHSKGGNLAMFAAFTMNKAHNDRLVAVYSFDGPGNEKELNEYPNWKAALPKAKKFLTNNDVIGVIYNKIADSKIVNSTGALLGGHDPFKWQVHPKDPDFQYAADRSFISKSHEKAITNWLVNMPQDDKKLAVDTLCEFLGQSSDIYELFFNAAKNVAGSVKKWKNYSAEQKERAKEIFKQLGRYYALAYSPASLAEERKAKKQINVTEARDD